MNVYWANALFSKADRSFNQLAAKRLRAVGHEVFLPQESEINAETAPSAECIFRTDTRALLGCNVVVACIDGNTIDPGVACEIGIAWCANRPLIGLCTDIRGDRGGESGLYRNPYVVGALTSERPLCRTLDDVLAMLGEIAERDAQSDHRRMDHFSDVAQRYAKALPRLGSRHEPTWDLGEIISSWLREASGRTILDFGCGNGWLANTIADALPEAAYIGFDTAPGMIATARSTQGPPTALWYDQLDDLMASRAEIDHAVASFAFHDLSVPQRALGTLHSLLQRDARVLIIDLARDDLAEMTGALKRDTVAPPSSFDSRFTVSGLVDLTEKAGFEVERVRVHTPRFTFETPEALMEHIEIFGIHRGMDLPLGRTGAHRHDEFARLIRSIVTGWTFPFSDRRSFIQCEARRT